MVAVLGVRAIDCEGAAGEFCSDGPALEAMEAPRLVVGCCCAPIAGTRFRLLMTVFFMATGRGTP